ncbi:MAG: sugar phosphate nucleotidyltransferase [Pseudomonadota bacterium]
MQQSIVSEGFNQHMISVPRSRARTAILPVAGRGMRMLPASRTIAKELMPVGRLPLVAHAIVEARAAGIERFVIITSRDKPSFDHALRPDPAFSALLRAEGKPDLADQLNSFVVSDQNLEWIIQDQQKGFGHAIALAADAVGDAPFVVLAPDDFLVLNHALPHHSTLAQMVALQCEQGGCMVMVEQVPFAKRSEYGIIEPGPADADQTLLPVHSIVEKPPPGLAPSDLGVIARYVLEPSIFPILADLAPGAGGEIQLTDALQHFARSGLLYAVKNSGLRYDCGTMAGWIRANMAVAVRHDPALIDEFQGELERLAARQLAGLVEKQKVKTE